MWRIASVFLIAILSLGTDANQLQPPLPTPPKASQEQKPHANQPAQNSKPPNGNPDKTPLSVTLNGPVTVEKSERDRSDEREESEHKSSNERWLIIWTGALVLVTLILAAITGFLARYTYKLWRSTNKLVEGADSTAKNELRAYMGVESINIPVGQYIRGNIVIRNFGKTMAKDAQVWINGTIANTGIAMDFPLDARKSKSVVMPGEAIRFEELIESEQEATGLLKSEKAFIYLWGRIEYQDVFGLTHWTIFRFKSYRQAFVTDQSGEPVRIWAVTTDGENANDAT